MIPEVSVVQPLPVKFGWREIQRGNDAANTRIRNDHIRSKFDPPPGGPLSPLDPPTWLGMARTTYARKGYAGMAGLRGAAFLRAINAHYDAATDTYILYFKKAGHHARIHSR